jgi:hypothetical protein
VVVHSLCIPEEKGVYDSLALQQEGDNHTGHHEERVFEETHHETGADLEGDVSGNPAVVCDQLREAHNVDVGVDCKAPLSTSNEDMMKQTHTPVLLGHSLKQWMSP